MAVDERELDAHGRPAQAGRLPLPDLRHAVLLWHPRPLDLPFVTPLAGGPPAAVPVAGIGRNPDREATLPGPASPLQRPRGPRPDWPAGLPRPNRAAAPAQSSAPQPR